VSRLDVLVATHPHPDHCNGLAAVLERFPVGEIWTIGLPRAFAETGPCLLALEQAKASGVLVRTFSRADPPFAWSGVGVNVLNPPLAPPPEWELNDRSLALRIAANGAAALLTADMERPAEESLLAEGGDVSAGVVQVGHHGSYSSSTEPFVAAVRPAHALFPVGFQNQYHLPRAEIVERWRMIGAQIWRTDRDGAIECVARAGEWSCRSIAPAPSNPLLRL
jgi:competence protein ComEC